MVYFAETPAYRELHDVAGLEFVTFEEMQKKLAEEYIQQFQKAGASSLSMCSDTSWWWHLNEDKTRPVLDPMPKTSNQVDGLSAVQVMKKSGAGA